MSSPELNKMLGQWIKHIPGPFGPSRPDLQLVRNRAIQEILTSKALEAAEELRPNAGQIVAQAGDPEVWSAFAHFAMEAADNKWPGFRELMNALMQAEVGYWRRSKVCAA